MNVMTRELVAPARLPAPLRETTAPATQAVSLDLTGLLRGLRRRWLWIALPAALALAAALGAALLVKPRYASAVQILVDPREFVVLPSQGGVSQGTSAELAASESETAAGLLRSAGVLSRVVRGQSLDQDPEFLGPAPVAGFDDAAQRALTTLGLRTTVRRAERSFIVEVEVWTRDSEKSARIANAIAQSYLADRLSARAALTGRAAEALDARLDDLGRRVREADQKVADYKSRNALIGADGSLVAEQQLTELSKQIVTAQARVVEARKRQDQVEAARTNPALLGDSADALASATVSQLRARYAEASRQSATLATRLGPQHPDVTMARAQLKDARAQLEAELARIGRAAQGEMDRARASETGLERRLAALKGTAGETSEALVRLRELERQAEASRTIYSALLNQAKLFTEQQGIDNANARVVSPAVPSPRTSGPSRMLIVMGGLIGGLLLGFALALVRELTDTVLYEKADFAAVAHMPVLAALPPGRRPRGSGPEATRLDPADTPLAGIAHRLADLLGTPTGRSRSLVFLALEPGFETTRLAFAVAVSLSLDDASVLFVDARGRDGLTAGLRAGDEPGLSDVIGRRTPLERAMVLHDEPGVGILTAGRAEGAVRPTPERIHTALLEPASRFAHVVVDGGAPLRDGSALAYAAAVDDVVLVASAGHTRRPALEESVELLARTGANLRGLVLV